MTLVPFMAECNINIENPIDFYPWPEELSVVLLDWITSPWSSVTSPILPYITDSLFTITRFKTRLRLIFTIRWWSTGVKTNLVVAGNQPKPTLRFFKYKSNQIWRIGFWGPHGGETRGTHSKWSQKSDWPVGSIIFKKSAPDGNRLPILVSVWPLVGSKEQE